MWKWQRPLTKVFRPILPDGIRIYAIGDIHGRADLLKLLLSRIDSDLAKNPVANAVQIFLGDYIDRGPDSAPVIDLLIERSHDHHVICLKGNHELAISEFLENPRVLSNWVHYGALPTLTSYGLKPALKASSEEQTELANELRRVMPASHNQFFAGLKLSYTCGDFFFVHAGVRPGTPLACQRDEDLLWIREDFLLHEEPFEKIIVHGHTPVREPDVRINRINIDTGAYATGRLTCLKLEQDQILFI